uniref:hypothetical protein n=1 Tax=Streptomyces katsurahamanus TaxID=2577098 RepID=UPI0018865655
MGRQHGPAGLVPGAAEDGPGEQAAAAFERATRSRIRADLDSTRALRRSVQTIWRNPTAVRDDAGLALLLDATLTAVAFAIHWHRTHGQAQQKRAARQTLAHRQTAYTEVTGPVLAGLAQRTPSPQTRHRHTPSPRADAARIRSTTRRPSVVTPPHAAAITPPPQATPTRRR